MRERPPAAAALATAPAGVASEPRSQRNPLDAELPQVVIDVFMLKAAVLIAAH